MRKGRRREGWKGKDEGWQDRREITKEKKEERGGEKSEGGNRERRKGERREGKKEGGEKQGERKEEKMGRKGGKEIVERRRRGALEGGRVVPTGSSSGVAQQAGRVIPRRKRPPTPPRPHLACNMGRRRAISGHSGAAGSNLRGEQLPPDSINKAEQGGESAGEGWIEEGATSHSPQPSRSCTPGVAAHSIIASSSALKAFIAH